MSARYADLELARLPGRSPRPPSRPLSAIAIACSRETTTALEDVVRLDLLLHLLLDLREILRRDAVRQIDVVIEAVLDRRPGGELRLRPDAQDGRGQHMRGGMADALEVGHLVALFEGLAFVGHLLRDSSTSLGMTKDGRRKYVGRRVTKTLNVCHLGALVQGFAFVGHDSERFLDFRLRCKLRRDLSLRMTKGK